MASRSVYLGLLDIDIRGNLDLKTSLGQASPSDVLKYLFAYAIVADEVCMQGSAPLKSKSVFIAFTRLAEAFQRNELHEEKPIFSFVLSGESESYLSYLVERLSFLRVKGGHNAERSAYLGNDGLTAAQMLDKCLNIRHVKKRTRSVSDEYKSSLLLSLRSGRYNEHGVKDDVAEKAIKLLTEEQIIQTHHLIESLHLQDIEQVNAVYRTARERYRKANAYGSESINSETKPHFKWKNILAYLSHINLTTILSKDSALEPMLLYRLRILKSLKAMNDIYFECQDQADIDALLNILNQLRINGKLRSLLKQSPGAAIAYFFESLNQAEIGYKSVNKGLEELSKVFLLNVADEVFAKKVYSIHSCMEMLARDLAVLTHHSSGTPSGAP
ncbi:MAG: hypothetical protein HOP06_09940 [Methylotenera sp.]|nr:hypothetical protein [Methylotenera sp.]